MPSRYRLEPVGEMPFVIGPDISVVHVVGNVFCALQKVGVLFRRMPGNEVEYHLNALGVRRLYKVVEIAFRAEAFGHFKVVAHVVSAVSERRIVMRIEPYSVAAERFYIVELARYSLEIAVTVAVGVHIRIGIDLVKDRRFQPCV